jgi:hypothetical protein
MAFSWANLPGKPFVTVSPIGGALPNNGADFGPNTAGTTTNGIQEAIASLPGSGGVVYCLAGSYTLTTSLYNTGNFQVVMFAAGAILNFSAAGAYQTVDLNGPSDILVGTRRSPEVNFHDCYWFGNGAQVNASGMAGEQVFAAQHSAAAVSPPGYRIIVDGFAIANVGNTSFFIGANNYISGVTYGQQIRQVRFSRIAATWKAGATAASGCAVQGSAREIYLADLTIDTSNVAAGTSYSNCFIRAASGDTEDVVIARSTFIQNGSSGNVFDIQGNASQREGSASRSCFNIRFEDCVFDSKAASVVFAGSGGGWIDDNDSTGNTGFVYNVEFCRCEFGTGVTTNVGITFQSAGSKFGYMRFSEGTIPGGFSSSLTGRGPGDPGSAVPWGTGPPYTYTNIDGFEERVIVDGGVTSITLNSQPTGVTSGAFVLRNGDYITVNAIPTSSAKQPM